MPAQLTRRPLSVGSLRPTAAIAPNRFVQLDGTQSGAGEYSSGISHYAGVAGGDLIPFTELGREILEVGAAVAAGTLLESDAQGRGITKTTGIATARAVTSAAAAGEFVEVWVLPN